jgi:hypothetical protein
VITLSGFHCLTILSDSIRMVNGIVYLFNLAKTKLLKIIFFSTTQRPFFLGQDEGRCHRNVHEEQGQHDACGRSKYRG